LQILIRNVTRQISHKNIHSDFLLM
jgi:hypothetical protein